MHNLDALLKIVKKRWWLSRLIVSTNLFLATICVGFFASILLNIAGSSPLSNTQILAVSFAIFIGFVIYQKFSSAYARLSKSNLLVHIDRAYAETEESAHLLFKDVSQLSSLQTLQQKRIKRALHEHKIDIQHAIYPLYQTKKGLWLSICFMTISFLLHALLSNIEGGSSPLYQTESNVETPSSSKPNVDWQIVITPPNYTQLPKQEINDFNIEAAQGSTIQWIAQSEQHLDLSLNISQQASQPFKQLSPDTYQASWKLNAPVLYSINNLQDNSQNIPIFYTINMLRDNPPSIQITTPLATVSEFKRSETPVVDAQVIVEDDYGLTDVLINASIAKGSGESVKFRDEVFKFDSYEDIPVDANSANSVKRIYQKRWDFLSLNMEPGDELYFTVSATDNRADSPQNMVSQTKILKWLDDDDVGISSDGILMDFIPEYFKSQRQIIIETIELIDRKSVLSQDEFDETSRDLAIAQSDLKLRYGQYLGDEFETGVMQTMEAGPNHALDEHNDGEHEHDHDHEEETQRISTLTPEHSHEHSSSNESSSLSGYDEMIDMFGHNHGSADTEYVGPKTGQLNPRALMKLSIQNMWQAELYLHLSDPINALPYEQEALDYLNRARKADRVYVKRLGFKPPPVTEDRRYQGELNDILEPKRQQSFEINNTEQYIVRQLLNTLAQVPLRSPLLNQDDTLLITQSIELLNSKLNNLSDTADTLSILAMLERIRIEKQWTINDCENCIKNIKAYFWQTLKKPIAKPQLIPKRAETDIVENFKRVMQQP